MSPMRVKGSDLVDVIQSVNNYLTDDYQTVAFAAFKRIRDDGNTVQFPDILVALDELRHIDTEVSRMLKSVTLLSEKARKIGEERRRAEESWKRLLASNPIAALCDDPLMFAHTCFVVSSATPYGMDSICKKVENSSAKLGWFEVATGGADLYVAAKVDSDRGTCGLGFGLNELPSGASSASAAYYLPWSEKTVYRVTLDRGTGPYAPKVAFTANLTGCQIGVRGAPDLPTFYHANCSATSGSDDEKIALKQGALLMSADIDAFELLRVSGRKYDSGSSEKVLRPLDYVDLAIQGVTVTESEHSYRQCVGAVFGVQKDGAWAFYYQAAYFEKKTDLSSLKSTLTYHILHAGKLWP